MHATLPDALSKRVAALESANADLAGRLADVELSLRAASPAGAETVLAEGDTLKNAVQVGARWRMIQDGGEVFYEEVDGGALSWTLPADAVLVT